MPTPESGTYDYPTGEVAFAGPGYPEAFSLWVFIFDPDAEETEAGPWTGVFLGGGDARADPDAHAAGPGHLVARTVRVSSEWSALRPRGHRSWPEGRQVANPRPGSEASVTHFVPDS